jgi:hypothetical protein
MENMTEVARHENQFSAFQTELNRSKEIVRFILIKDFNMKKCVPEWY